MNRRPELYFKFSLKKIRIRFFKCKLEFKFVNLNFKENFKKLCLCLNKKFSTKFYIEIEAKK